MSTTIRRVEDAKMTLIIDLTDEERTKILNTNFDTFADAANKAIGAALVDALENGITIENVDHFDYFDNAVWDICNSVNMEREGATDTEPRMIVADIIRKFFKDACVL